jgi:phenylpropionate dioxygenase-like ring-hydroxylating dioxygenase large terminal subunit
MLSREDNAYLTRTGPDTPMGTLFRRFWLPLFLSSELPEHDGPPLRTRILGEDLVGYRDSNGHVGVLDAYCPHRRAPLFYGRNEECGLRCAYHGWKFDAEGTCVDMPSEPADSDFKDRLSIKAYPTYEVGGLVWIYMGPSDKQPQRPPLLEWTELPDTRRRIVKWFHENNYMQGIEGDIDTAHVSFLHSDNRPEAARSTVNTNPSGQPRNFFTIADKHPRLTAMDTDYGMVYGGRRYMPDGGFYWRVTQWLLPSFSLIPGRGRRGGTAWIPVDDHHCVRYSIGMTPDWDMDKSAADNLTPGGKPQQFTLSDGTIIDTMIPYGTKANQYQIDRDLQKAGHFSGILSIPMQDKAMIEGMTRTVDRSLEHLGSSDVAVIAARRRLMKLARDLEHGIEPVAPAHPELYRVRPLDLLSSEPEFGALLEQHAEEAKVPVASGSLQ